MGNLQRIIHKHLIFTKLFGCCILGRSNFLFPSLVGTLVLVSTIAKLTDSVDIEIVFSHANDVFSRDFFRHLCLLVDVSTILLQSLRNNRRLLFFWQLIEQHTILDDFARELFARAVVVTFGSRIVVASPDPLHLSLAVVLCLIVITGCTSRIVHDGTGLQTIGQDNIRIHGANISARIGEKQERQPKTINYFMTHDKSKLTILSLTNDKHMVALFSWVGHEAPPTPR